MNGGDATEYEDIANMPPGQPPSSQQPTSVATNGGTNYTTNGGCNPADTMSMSPQIKVRTLGFVENGRLLKQEYLEEEDDAAAVGGHSSGNTDHQDQVPNYEAPITVPTNTITTTVPQRVGGLAADEREDLVEFMINQTTRGQQQQPRSQQHQQPPPPPSPSPSTSSSSQVKLEHSPPPESSGIKTEIHDFDTTLPYDGELLSVKKEEHSTTEYMDEQCRPKRYQYFSGESEDDSDEEDEDCDCPDCLIEEVQIIDQNDPVQPPPAPTPPLSASGTDNLEIPAEWYAADRHLRPRTARQQQQQGQRRGQQQGRTTRRQVKRCTWENCEYTNENTHQMYVHIRTRHFGVLATKALQKAANNVEERPPSDFMRNEMIEVPDTPLTDYQADQLQAVFDLTADMTLQEFNSAMENLAFNLKIHERRITDWFKNRRLIQKRMFENGGEIAPNVNRCKRGRPPKKQQQQIRQQLIQQQQQQSGPDEQQAGCSFWNGQNGQQTVTASSTTSENFNDPQPSSFFSPSPSSNPTPPPLTNGNFSSKRNDNSQLPLQNCSRSLPLPNPSIITLSQHKQQLQQQQQQSATVSMAKMSLQNDQSNVGDSSNQQSSTTAVNQATAVPSVLNLSTRGPPAFVAVIDGQVRQLYSLPRGFTGTVPLTQVSNLQLAEAAVSNSIAAATTNSGSPIPVNNNNANSSRNENPTQISVPRPSSVPPSSQQNTTNSPSLSQGTNPGVDSTATPPPPPRSRIPCKHVLEAAAAVRAAKPPPPVIKDEQEDSDDDIQILDTPWTTPSTSRPSTSTSQRGTGATNTTIPYHKIPCRRASAQLNRPNNTFSASTTPRASTFDQSNDTTTTTATQLGIRRVVSETEVEQKSGPTMCQARLAQLMADIKVETAKQLQTSVPEKQVACLIKKGPERPPPNSCLFYNSSSRFTAFSRSRPPPPPIPKEKQQDYSSKVLEALQKSGCLTPAVESSASTGESSVSAVESSASTSAASTSPPTVNKEQKKQQQQPQSKPAANQNRLNERLNETSTESTAAAAEASTPTECNSRALNLSAFSSATVVPSASTDSLSTVESSSSTVAPSAFASSTPAVNKQKKKQPKQPKPAANQTRSNERLNASSSSTESATSPPPPPRVARVHPLPPPSRSTSSSSTPRSTSSGNRNNNYRIGSNVRRPTEVANDVSIALENALVHSGVSLAEAIASSSDASNPFSETSNASLGTVSAVTTSTTVTSSSRPEPRAGTASGTSNSLRTPTSTSTTQNRPSEHRPHHSKVARTSSETSNPLRSPRKSTAFTFSSSRPTEQPKVTVSGTSTLISVASAATSSRPPPEHRHQQSKISATSETTKNPSLSRTSSASSLGSSSLSNTSAKAPLKPSSASSAKSPRTEVSQPPKSQQNKQPQRPSSISSLNAVQRPTSRSSLDSSTSSARGGNVPPLRSPPPSSSTKSGNKRYRPLSPSEDSATPPVKRQTSRPEFENSSSRSTLNNEKPRSASGRDHPKVQQQQKYPQNREPQQQHYPQAPRTPRRELCSPTRPVASGVPSSVALSAPTTVTTPTTPTAPTESVRARLSSFLDPRSQAMPLSSAGAVPVANRVPSRPLPRQTSLTEVGSTLSRLAASSTASAAATLSRQNSLGNEVGGSSGSKTPRRLSNDGDADDGVGGGPLNRYVSSGNGGGNSSDRNSEPLPKIQKLQNQNSFYADFFQPEEQNDVNKNAPSSSSSSSRPPPLNDSRKESSSSSSRPPPPNDSRDSSRFSNSNSADPRSPSPSSSSSNSNLNNNNNNTNKNRDSGSASASSSAYSSTYSTYLNSGSKSSSSINQQATASAASTESSSSSSSTPAKPILNEYSRKYRIYRTGNGTTKIQLKPEEPYSSSRNVSPPPTHSSTNSDSSSNRPPSSPPTSLISEPIPEPRLLDSAVPRIPIRRVLDDPSLAPVDPRLARTSAFSANLVSATSDSVYSRIATSSASVAPSILFNTTVRPPPPPPPGASIPVRTDPRMSNYSFPTFPMAAAPPPSPVPTTPSRSLISVRTDARLFHSFAGAAASPSSSTPSAIPVLTDARMSNYSFPGSTAVPSVPKTPLLPAPSLARSTSFNSTVGSPAPGSSNLVRTEPRMSNYSIVPGSAVPSPGPTAPPVSTDNPAELFPNDVDYRLRPHPPTENSRADSRTSNFSYPRSSGHSNNRNNNIILGHVTVQMDAKSSQILEDRTTQLPLEVVPTAEEMLKELQSLPLVDDDEEDEEEELLSLPEILDNHLMRMKSGGSNGSLLDGTTTTTGKSVDDLFGMVMKSADGKEVKEDLSKKGDDGQPKNVEDLFGIVLKSADDGQKDAEELMMLQGDDHPDARELNDQEEEELLKDDTEKELNDEEEEELLKGDEEDDELEKEEKSEESEEEDSDSDYEVVDSYIVPPVLTLQPVVKTEELEVEMDSQNNNKSPESDNSRHSLDEPVQLQEQQESDNSKGPITADDGLDEEMVVVKDSVEIKEEDIKEEEMEEEDVDEDEDEDDDDCFEVVDSCIIPANVVVEESVETQKEPETQKVSTEVQVGQLDLVLSEPMDLELMEQPEEQQEKVGNQKSECSSNDVPTIEKPETKLATVVLTSVEPALAVSDSDQLLEDSIDRRKDNSVGTDTREESSNGHHVPLTDAAEMFESIPVVTMEANVAYCPEVVNEEQDESNLKVLEEDSEKVESTLEVAKVEPPKPVVPTELGESTSVIEPLAHEKPESEPPNTTVTITDSTESSLNIQPEESVAGSQLSAITIDDSNSLVALDCGLGGSAKLSPVKSSPSSQRLVHQNSTEFEPNMAILEPELTEIPMVSEPVAMNPTESVPIVVIPESEPSTSSTTTISSNIPELGSLSQAESSNVVDSCPKESQLCDAPPIVPPSLPTAVEHNSEPVEMPSSSSSNFVLEKVLVKEVVVTESPTKPTTRSQAAVERAESSSLSKSHDEDADDEDDDEEGDASRTLSKRPKRSKAQQCTERNQSLLKSSAKSCKATISEASSSTSTPSKAKKCLVKSISSDNFYSTRRSVAAAAKTNAESEDGGGGALRKRSLRDRSLHKVDSPVKKAKLTNTPCAGGGTPSRPALRSSTVSSSTSVVESAAAPPSSSLSPAQPTRQSLRISSSRAHAEEEAAIAAAPPGARDRREYFRDYMRKYRDTKNTSENNNANQTANKNPVPNSSSSATKRKGSK